MVMGYWSVAILFWQLSIDHIVNGQYKRYGFAKTHLRHPSLPFESLPYPTRTICRRVRTYVRSVSHVTTKRKEVDHILWVWGSVSRALRVRGSPAKKFQRANAQPYANDANVNKARWTRDSQAWTRLVDSLFRITYALENNMHSLFCITLLVLPYFTLCYID